MAMEIAVSTYCAAAPAAVFAVATDIEKWPQRISGISRVDLLTEGPVAVGTRFRETRTMFGREAAEEMRVEALEPPSKFVLSAASRGSLYRVVHRFTPRGEGTEIEIVFGAEPRTFAARVFSVLGVLMKGALRKKLQDDIEALARAAETEAKPK